MKINKTDRVLQIYKKTGVNRENISNNKLGKDQIEFSQKAKDYQFAIDKFKELPNIRMEKVGKLKEKVQSGTYNVESEKNS